MNELYINPNYKYYVLCDGELIFAGKSSGVKDNKIVFEDYLATRNAMVISYVIIVDNMDVPVLKRLPWQVTLYVGDIFKFVYNDEPQG